MRCIGEHASKIADYQHPKLQEIARKYHEGAQVVEEVLRCSKEHQHWNPSGSYCAIIPWCYTEGRELRPTELLRMLATSPPDGLLQEQGGTGPSGSDARIDALRNGAGVELAGPWSAMAAF